MSTTPTTETNDWPSPLRSWLMLALLMLLYTSSFMDRQVIALLVGPLKEDLVLSDTQISLLQGFAFALFYTLLGVPIGRLADRASRKFIITIGATFWSLMTAACGLSSTYLQLFLARIGVGIGEATLSPAAYSMITDSFKPHRLGLAQSIYALGITIGSGVAFLVGGLVVEWAETAQPVLPFLGEVRSWQFVFIVVGLPGIPLALLMLLVREPKRRGMLAKTSDSEVAQTGTPANPDRLPIRETMRFIAARWQVFTAHFGGFALLAVLGLGYAAWFPTTMIRTHGLTPGEVGQMFGIITLVFASSGVIALGWYTDFLTRKGYTDAPMRAVLHTMFVLGPTAVLVPLMPTAEGAWSVLIFQAFFGSAWPGVAAAALQMITPNQFRAQVAAVYLLVLNLLGLGVGPTLYALVTDYVFGDPMLVRYSLALVAGACSLLALPLFIWGLPHFRKARAEAASWGG